MPILSFKACFRPFILLPLISTLTLFQAQFAQLQALLQGISSLYLHNALYAFISAFSMLRSYCFCNALNSCISFSYLAHLI